VLIPWIKGADGQKEQLRLTKEAIESGAEVIFEAAFIFDNAFAKVDMLKRDEEEEGAWEICEIKSTTTLEEEHIDDIAYQQYVVVNSGLRVSNTHLGFLNNEYVRMGELNLGELFKFENVTEKTDSKQMLVPMQIDRLRKVLLGEPPTCSIGKHCDKPYECGCKALCWKDIPKDSIFDIKGNGIKKWDVYAQGHVEQAKIPLSLLKGKQLQQVGATVNKQNFFDKKAVASFLEKVTYPLCHLDFETFCAAIPRYDGLRPYQQVPFQFSVHTQESEGAELKHHAFLAEAGCDPRPQLFAELAKILPKECCIVVWNMSFEKGILEKAGAFFEEYYELAKAWVSNMVDLMVPFRERAIYNWDMKGSYSIKYVLPSMVPSMSYKGMEISNGLAAMYAYYAMATMMDKPEELAIHRKKMLDYCHLDTIAMHEIILAMLVMLENYVEPEELAKAA
jgi:hypothetical protein